MLESYLGNFHSHESFRLILQTLLLSNWLLDPFQWWDSNGRPGARKSPPFGRSWIFVIFNEKSSGFLASQCKMCVRTTDAALLQMVITKLKMIERMFKIFAKDTFETMEKIVLAEPLITSKAMLVMDLLRQRKQGAYFII